MGSNVAGEGAASVPLKETIVKPLEYVLLKVRITVDYLFFQI